MNKKIDNLVILLLSYFFNT